MRFAWLLALGTGCFSPQLSDAPSCGPDDVCPAGFACAAGTCVTSSCAAVANEQPCATQSIVDGVCVDDRCVSRGCGDGIVVEGERCDDGNRANGDGCNASCESDETCGNGFVDVGEQCDDGNVTLSSDGCSATCALEFEYWTEVHPETITHQVAPALVYDDARKVVVRFGGRSGGGTWEWNGIGWRHRTSVATPPRRWWTSMAYESSRKRMLLFGGVSVTAQGMDGPALADTWSWDGAQWREHTPVHVPPARVDAAIAYDPVRDRVVLVGGQSAYPSGDRLTDTWEWNGTDWEERAPATTPGIGGRGGAAYDPVRAKIVWVGEGGAWEWNGTTWTQGPTPPATPDYHVVYDAGRQAIVNVGFPTRVYGATWTTAPGIDDHAAAYDNDRRVLVGLTQAGSSGIDVYELSAAATSWQQRVTGLSTVLTGGAYDSDRARIVSTSRLSSGAHQTWEFDGESWWPVASTAPGTGLGLAYDPVRRVTIACSGYTTAQGATLSGTWQWDGRTWTQIAVASPPPRGQAMVAYDKKEHRVILAGGPAGTTFSDTWSWDGVSWTQIGDLPTPISLGAIAYDERRERIVVVGGVAGQAVSDATLVLEGNQWTALELPARAPAIYGAALVYDGDRGRLVLHGGSATSILAALSSTWVLDPLLGWIPAQPNDPSRAKLLLVGAYHSARRSFVAAAGLGPGGVSQRDTWLLTVGSNEAGERCLSTHDDDGDGLSGCKDPDCWGRCTPHCPPNTVCDLTRPRCGDNVCAIEREDHLLCPEDCS